MRGALYDPLETFRRTQRSLALMEQTYISEYPFLEIPLSNRISTKIKTHFHTFSLQKVRKIKLFQFIDDLILLLKVSYVHVTHTYFNCHFFVVIFPTHTPLAYAYIYRAQYLTQSRDFFGISIPFHPKYPSYVSLFVTQQQPICTINNLNTYRLFSIFVVISVYPNILL